ncbi:hypothetical protein V474_13445 [Novosphingobium barchaimii LL02]|uniref:Benenodin family lasso peptide n=1 Tax=Novosphingobium barchaimii LL02 TaxID=1114963 RepID=A0A0J7XYI6_9SPHN|nr:benenodin family lasso peptide [Novosphingobium barchaimii]KMS56594.1 hypothetical protein V474_13445 [Novosphingobium barchaimii LL02]
MEREYEAAEGNIFELGAASELTNGVGIGTTDLPARQQSPGILDD